MRSTLRQIKQEKKDILNKSLSYAGCGFAGGFMAAMIFLCFAQIYSFKALLCTFIIGLGVSLLVFAFSILKIIPVCVYEKRIKKTTH